MNETFDKKFSQVQTLENDIQKLNHEIQLYKPMEGWKRFYEDIYLNQMPWSKILSELSLSVPPHVVIDNFQMSRGNKRVWPGTLKGNLKADNYQEGLKLVREFGGRIDSNPLFELRNIQYSPKTMKDGIVSYNFTITLSVRGDTGHEG